LIARLEYIYDEFSNADYSYDYTQAIQDQRAVYFDINTVRAAIAYKF
jgi:opacity protein-like surface antigen